MFQKIKNFLIDPTKGILTVFFLILIASYVVAILGDSFFFKNLNFSIVFIISLILVLIFLEIVFKLFYFYLNKKIFITPPKVNFNKIHYKGHPYIPYVLKENAVGPPPHPLEYPLHRGKYKFHNLSSNNLGFFNGPNGDRNIDKEKPDDLIRVNCLGASTTQNYLQYNNEVFSYPLVLEKKLNHNSKANYEVNNFGQGGYNTADILVRFLLQTIDTKPDIIILYHGYADIRSYLLKDFRPDYSHSRYNLSELLVKLKFSSLIPKLPFSFLNYFFSKWFPSNLSNSLVEIIHKNQIDININPDPGLKIYERNIQNLISICKAKNIKIILSTFCHILYKGIEDNEISIKYEEIVEKENNIIRKLAALNNVKIVDNAKIIPKNEKFFVDSIHFSHLGMEELAENFSQEIKKMYGK